MFLSYLRFSKLDLIMPYSAHSFRASLYIGNTYIRKTIGLNGLVYYIDVCGHLYGSDISSTATELAEGQSGIGVTVNRRARGTKNKAVIINK